MHQNQSLEKEINMISSFLKDSAIEIIRKNPNNLGKIPLSAPGFFVSATSDVAGDEVILGEIEVDGNIYFIIQDMD